MRGWAQGQVWRTWDGRGGEQIQELLVGRSQTVNREDFSGVATALHVPVGAGGPVLLFKTPFPSWLPSHRACVGLDLGVLGLPRRAHPTLRGGQLACCADLGLTQDNPPHRLQAQRGELRAGAGSQPPSPRTPPLPPAPSRAVGVHVPKLSWLMGSHTPCLGPPHRTTQR